MGIFGKPFGRRCRRHIFVIIQLAVDLFADLHGVATVGKHGGLVLEHSRASRAAAEAGQPVEPLGIGADIFAHMLIGNRDDETVEAALGQFGAQRVETGFMGLHEHG